MDFNNDWILQWGDTPSIRVGAGKSGNVDGTFPITFPTAVLGWAIASSSAYQDFHCLHTVTTTGYTYVYYNSAGSATHTDQCKYIVIGY